MSYANGLNRQNLAQLRTQLEALFRANPIEGLTFTLGNFKFGEAEVRIELKGAVTDKQTRGQSLLDLYMKTNNLNKMNTHGMELIDFMPKNYKMPFIYTMGGKRFKCSEVQARALFGA